MADNDSTDMLMAATPKGGSPLAGDGLTALDPADTEMLTGITAGNFSEIQDINFGIGVEDSESSDGANSGNAMHDMQEQTFEVMQKHLEKVLAEQVSGKVPKMAGGGRKSKQFKNFVDYGEVTDGDGKAVYSTVFDPITITRQIDKMSTDILNACATQTPLDKVVVVKRKFTGLTSAYTSYVRLEFDECLVTAVDWDHGETFTEKMKFVFRSLTVKYRPQSNDGTLLAPKTMTYSLSMSSE